MWNLIIGQLIYLMICWIDVSIIDSFMFHCCFVGYYGEGLNAIIVFAACYLPDSSCEDYTYIMENLFL